MNDDERLTVPIVGGPYHNQPWMLRGDELRAFRRGEAVDRGNLRPIVITADGKDYPALVPVEKSIEEAHRLVGEYYGVSPST